MLVNKVNEVNIQLVRGNTLSFMFEIEDLNVDLDNVYFTVKENADDDTPLFEKSFNNGISKMTGSKILYSVKIAPEDTKYLDVKSYYYDLEVQIGDDVYTIIKGLLKLVQDVTIKEV